MALEGRKYLEELVSAIICIPDAFRIRIEDGKFIFSVMSVDQKCNDYFAVSAIYDAIVDLDKKIKYSFSQVLSSDLSETLDGYSPFSELANKEFGAMYHIKNLIYRVSILWDLLAQLCNVKYHTGLETDKIYYYRYFTKFSSEENEIEIAKEIKAYLDEKEDVTADINPWPGNHAFLTDYRNKMTHRVTPGITSISSLGVSLRPPAMYLLHRVTEDYYKVSYFLCQLINEFLEEYKDWIPFRSPDLDGDNDE